MFASRATLDIPRCPCIPHDPRSHPRTHAPLLRAGYCILCDGTLTETRIRESEHDSAPWRVPPFSALVSLVPWWTQSWMSTADYLQSLIHMRLHVCCGVRCVCVNKWPRRPCIVLKCRRLCFLQVQDAQHRRHLLAASPLTWRTRDPPTATLLTHIFIGHSGLAHIDTRAPPPHYLPPTHPRPPRSLLYEEMQTNLVVPHR